jgi:hypothetical protein
MSRSALARHALGQHCSSPSVSQETPTKKEVPMKTAEANPRCTRPRFAGPCAWCAAQFGTIVELIDHVDSSHLRTSGLIDSMRS